MHRYVYYHCSKRKDPNCTEKSVELQDLTRQIDAILNGITISDGFKEWAIQYLHEIRKDEAKANEDTILAKQRVYESIVKQLDSLLLKYTSPENENGQLITEAEYTGLRNRLVREKAKLEDELKNVGQQIEEWVELSERTFNFARYAKIWFAKGDIETKRAIFACLGSNFLLKDRKVALTLRKPFQFIFDNFGKAEKELSRLEPLKNRSNIGDLKVFAKRFPVLSG